MKKQQAYQGVTIVVSIYDQAIRLLPPSHDHGCTQGRPEWRGAKGAISPGFQALGGPNIKEKLIFLRLKVEDEGREGGGCPGPRKSSHGRSWLC